MAYGSDSAFTAWLAINGQTLPAGAPDAAILRQRGSQYVDNTYGSRFWGVPTLGIAQERAWPRTGAKAYGQIIPDDVIPVAIEQASYAAAYQEAIKPGSLTVSATAIGAVKRKKIGPIEKEFFEGSGDVVADGTLKLSAVEGLLAPYLKPETTLASLGLWAVG
ncbi:DnaT-like ssDNA-binding protein [Brevundimonas sp. CEF1]|uniref:DnaT-like ssDNA-binding protein n=1 Tax=Brevundimonas sp. CEF1 TaxID=3442642 RepID=UPI003F513585